MAQFKIPVVAIVGPTASGKTELSVNLARRISGEIISADSMQIYEEFNICTAKPNKEHLESVKHYCVGEISVRERFSVADYVKRAHICAKKITEKNKVAFVVGGTGLYIDSFLKNVDFGRNTPNLELRESLYKDSLCEKDKLYTELQHIDPMSARQIHPNDIKRITRALEFYYSYGYPISEQVKRSLCMQSPYEAVFIGINFEDRSVLYDRINRRVDNMLRDGLVEEVKHILKLEPSDTANEAIGYKEIIPYIRGQCSLDEAVENLKRDTRHYAKRQITWFKRNKDIHWFYADKYYSFENMVLDAEKVIKEKILNGNS